VQRFRDEAVRLQELGRHPQIPALLDYIEQNNASFLVQDYIDGLDLAEILATEGPFNEQQVRELLNDLLPVLQFIHHHRVIHRDIKPQNIIRPQSGGPFVLVDFGASKYATEAAIAQTGTIIGSAGFAAPEQAMGKAVLSSDLYSLGVTCAHLLTAIHPFDLYSISQDAWIWKDYLVEPVSDQLADILDKLMQRAVSQRYRTAAAVLDDLQQPLTFTRSQKAVSSSTSQPLGTQSTSPNLPPSVSIAHPKQPWQCIHTLIGHTGSVTAVAISPDGRVLASGSADRSIRLWEIQTGKLLHTFAGRSLWASDGHSDRISALVFSADGMTLMSSSADGSIKLWDLSQQKLSATVMGQGWVVGAIALSPDDQLLVSGSADGTITLWDWLNRTPIERWKKHRDQVSALAISPNSQRLVSGSYDKTLRLWDLQTGQALNTIRGHADRISAIALSPDWSLLISGSWDRNLNLWDVADGELLCTLARHTDRINAIAVNPDGKLFASAGEDTRIYLWHLETGDRLCTLGHSWSVNALAFSPDGQTLVSGSADETIKIWQR
jgi:sugar lactone lactonase YvrE